ncbi:glutaredoxin family protein [Maricurvus nonylphenolicus]|uniref:glutaredoxin family protein n=1 Tax=Maricurvus nonylphenolicus TaxID=1008307 RepID=UPI0036F2EE3C
MTSSKTLYLYTTLGCHLCEQAKQLAWPVLEHYGFRLQEVEIADDEDLMTRYGIRIPVVARADDGAELGWPFDQQALSELLK